MAPREWFTSVPCLVNFGFTALLLCFCIIVTFTSVRVVRHITAAGRVTSEVPWYGRSKFQYAYDLFIMLWSLPIMYVCAAAAEVKAFFTTPFLDKKAFVYHVATKPQLSAFQGG
mmetsp:Transcript_66276/g.120863  ORF Transcript_66276/g.120863 Transcript_66276/m.120863 type:complete len:114 (-) Transcript_66276:7-348(-)